MVRIYPRTSVQVACVAAFLGHDLRTELDDGHGCLVLDQIEGMLGPNMET